MRYWLHVLFGHEWALDDEKEWACFCWLCKIVRWRD